MRVGEGLAFVALVAALVGAVGPAEHVSTTYSWPPPELSQHPPSRVWYTPLLLQRRLPASIAATLPCAPARPLANAGGPVTILATARSPERARGLSVRQEDSQLTIAVGDDVLQQVPLTGELAGRNDCAYSLSFADRRWSLAGGPTGVEHAGVLDRMPVVNGLFSSLDLSVGRPLSVDVTTEPHRADPIARQTVAWMVAAVCLVAALLLVGVGRRPRGWPALSSRARSVLAHAHPADAAIAVLLLGWWVLSPVFWDDGWSLARQTAFVTTGSFSNYYESLGAALPLGYWVDWLQHWMTQSTVAMLVLRLPALACLAATWVLCRWVLARGLPSTRPPSSVVLWALASAFAVGAMAWGMTLRPEPIVALLVMGVMACSVRFMQAPSSAPLAVAAVLVPLAITAHPAGLASTAPLVVIAPSLFRWARSQLPAVVTMLMSSLALVLILTFVGGDVEQRSTDTQIISEVSVTVASWRDELNRYQRFAPEGTGEIDPYGTPLRRASVALIGLALLAFVVRRRRRNAVTGFSPSAALAVGLVLLVATPSKWPWHFGVFLGLAAVAIATETEYLRTEPRRSRASIWVATGVIAVSTLAIVWSWAPQRSWNPVDLRSLEWTRPFEAFPALHLLVGLPLAGLLGIQLLRARRKGDGRGEAVHRAAGWITPVLLVPMIAFTVVFLVADATATSSWTFTRQTLESVSGNAGCGLADDLLVPNMDSVRPLPAVTPADVPVPEWVPPAPAAGLSRFALGPTRRGTASSPWFTIPRGERVGVFVAGIPGELDQLMLDTGRLDSHRIERVETRLFEVDLTSEGNARLDWRFLPAGALPGLPQEADVVRISLRSDAHPGAAIAVTGPVVYGLTPLTGQVDRGGSLVVANLRMYFPCTRFPRLSNGVAEPPVTTVTTLDSWTPVTFAESSPFGGVLDLYRLRRISLQDSEDAPEGLSAFEVARSMPGGRVANPIAVNRPS